MPEHRCEAPFHVPECDGLGATVDHFTPKSVGKKLGWTKAEISSPDNKQRLSVACHRDKDKQTERIGKYVDRQMAGGKVRFGDYHTKFFPNDVVVEVDIFTE